MKAGTKAKLQEILFEYPYLEKEARKAEEGSRRAELLLDRKEAIDKLLDNSGSDSLREAINLYYFSKPRRYTWQGVAYECNLHPSQLSRAHTDFLHRLAKELGEM